jgi:hypothetical protein
MSPVPTPRIGVKTVVPDLNTKTLSQALLPVARWAGTTRLGIVASCGGPASDAAASVGLAGDISSDPPSLGAITHRIKRFT